MLQAAGKLLHTGRLLCGQAEVLHRSAAALMLSSSVRIATCPSSGPSGATTGFSGSRCFHNSRNLLSGGLHQQRGALHASTSTFHAHIWRDCSSLQDSSDTTSSSTNSSCRGFHSCSTAPLSSDWLPRSRLSAHDSYPGSTLQPRHSASTHSRDASATAASTAGLGNGASPDNGAAPYHGAEPLEPLSQQFQNQSNQYRRELHAVNVAISTNAAIFVLKIGVYFLSHSSAMLAEALHSLCDVGNQLFLRTGIVKAQRKPTKLHPYGYARDKFVWSLIAAVGIFFLGAGVSCAHGLQGIINGGHAVEHLGWNLAVLGVSFGLEGYSLMVAVRTVMAGAQQAGMTFMEYVRRGQDPTSIAVMLEDSGAVAGLLIAGVCTTLVRLTGNVVWDSVGSLCVGTLLGAIASFLINRNRQFLIGRSMSDSEAAVIIRHLENDPVVNAVHDPKTEEIGPGIFRFKAEIDFSGEQVVERYMNRQGKEALMDKMHGAVCAANGQAMEDEFKAFGRGIISAVGLEVDRIEAEIQKRKPGILYVDLETDRGTEMIHALGDEVDRLETEVAILDARVRHIDLETDRGGAKRKRRNCAPADYACLLEQEFSDAESDPLKTI